jgi:para-nitrobenzyl esterase
MKTTFGEVVGVSTTAGNTFLGIPYAEPPVGALRWQPPKPHAPWSNPLDASHLGSPCPQPTDVSALIGAQTQNMMGAEDCLFLNIYTPANAANKKLPVMVWIHGGAYIFGSGGDYDGSALAEDNNVIVVTLNYRLGSLGFLALPSLGAESADHTSGNYGLMDQQLALTWVQDQIAVFGGDPGNITLFGESAGGSSVCYQLLSPKAKGLFQKAILESGVCLAPQGVVQMADAETTGQTFAEALGCKDADCLRGKPVADVTTMPSKSIGIGGQGTWGAVYGDSILPLPASQAFATGRFNQVPIINGTNHDEGRLFAFLYASTQKPVTAISYPAILQFTYAAKATNILAQYPLKDTVPPALAYSTMLTDGTFSCPNYRLEGLLAKYVPTFAYEFNDPEAVSSVGALTAFLMPGVSLGAYHSSEIAYIFRTRNALADPAHFTPQQDALSKQMVRYWVAFAQNSTPNGGDSPRWEPFKAGGLNMQNLAPDGISQVKDFANDHQCAFWDSLGG